MGINQGEPAAKVRRFIEQHRWQLRTALDHEGAVSRIYDVDAIPRTIIVGRDGHVRWVASGYHNDGGKSLKAALEAELTR
jgi:peroxiredoxin